MRLLIAIPCMDTVPVEFMKSLIRLTQKLSADGVDYTVAIESGTLVYMARDRLAGKAVNEGYSHVLWLDSDMVFEPELLEGLVGHCYPVLLVPELVGMWGLLGPRV